jgi:hypothetical protein
MQRNLTFKELQLVQSGLMDLTNEEGEFNPITQRREQKPRKLGGALGLKAARIMVTLEPILETFFEKRKELIDTYTDPETQDANGNRGFYSDEDKEAFVKKEKELLDVSHPFSVPFFTTKELDQPWVTGVMLYKLRHIISDFDLVEAPAEQPKKTKRKGPQKVDAA